MYIAREEKLAELDKILHGRSLHGSESLKSFLRFIVDRSVESRENSENQLKEYVIATEVFGRGRDFDSRIDSVVRVQAGRLRAKLHQYYSTEGKDDLVIIDLPKGQYTPVFSYAPKGGNANTHAEPASGAVPAVQTGGGAIRGDPESAQGAFSGSSAPISHSASGEKEAVLMRVNETRLRPQRPWQMAAFTEIDRTGPGRLQQYAFSRHG
jgi:hypothetical protein